MPYIKTEEVKEIRKQIKKALPNFKFSVTKHHHSSVCVSVLSGPITSKEFNLNDRNYDQVNEFHYKNHYSSERVISLFDTILKTINSVKEEKIICEDADYGSIPNFYINLEVGKWNKPYQERS